MILVGLPKIPGGQRGPSSIKPAVIISLTHESRHRNFGRFGTVRSDLLMTGCMDLNPFGTIGLTTAIFFLLDSPVLVALFYMGQPP